MKSSCHYSTNTLDLDTDIGNETIITIIITIIITNSLTFSQPFHYNTTKKYKYSTSFTYIS